MSDATAPQQSALVRWAVITEIGRVVVEAETTDVTREKTERKGYIILEVNRDNSRPSGVLPD